VREAESSIRWQKNACDQLCSVKGGRSCRRLRSGKWRWCQEVRVTAGGDGITYIRLCTDQREDGGDLTVSACLGKEAWGEGLSRSLAGNVVH
jgi:hypothetical protein